MTTTTALPRFPFAELFKREPQYEPASNFPTLTLASATGIVPSGNPTGSGSIGVFPTGTGTGSPFFPNSTIIGGTGTSPEPTGSPLSSFSIATSSALGPIKVPLTGATSLFGTSIPPALTGVASCPIATPETVTETVTETVSHMTLKDPVNEIPFGSSLPTSTSFNGALNAYAFDPGSAPSLKRITRSSASALPLPRKPSSTSATSHVPTKRDRVLNGSPIKKPTQSSDRHTPKKAKRSSSGYAPPSKYAHLTNHLVDSLGSNLICVLVGLNPGLRTASTGHAYNHPSNLFWKLLHSSGCTPRRCLPEEDGDMPRLYALGLTNIVERPTKDGGELSKEEMDAGVAGLEMKIARDRPEAVAIVGKSVWESVWRVRHGKAITKAQFRYGWQDDAEKMGVVSEGDEAWEGARVFVATTTSGLAAGMRPHEKEEVWRGLGEWVASRRAERLQSLDDVVPDT
ncbi:MAG: hypothetical protein Q9195_001720 [Heterodermia aff. obscurata]